MKKWSIPIFIVATFIIFSGCSVKQAPSLNVTAKEVYDNYLNSKDVSKLIPIQKELNIEILYEKRNEIANKAKSYSDMSKYIAANYSDYNALCEMESIFARDKVFSLFDEQTRVGGKWTFYKSFASEKKHDCEVAFYMRDSVKGIYTFWIISTSNKNSNESYPNKDMSFSEFKKDVAKHITDVYSDYQSDFNIGM